jgi:hypothetical protein
VFYRLCDCWWNWWQIVTILWRSIGCSLHSSLRGTTQQILDEAECVFYSRLLRKYAMSLAKVLFYYSMFYVMMATWDFTILFLFPKIVVKYWWTMTVYTLTAKTPNKESMAIENFTARTILQLLIMIAINEGYDSAQLVSTNRASS